MTAASPRRSHTETGRSASAAGTAPHWPSRRVKDGPGHQWDSGAGPRVRSDAKQLGAGSLAPCPLPASPRRAPSRPQPPAPFGRSGTALSGHPLFCRYFPRTEPRACRGSGGEPWFAGCCPSPSIVAPAGGRRAGTVAAIRCCRPQSGASGRACAAGSPPAHPHARVCASALLAHTRNGGSPVRALLHLVCQPAAPTRPLPHAPASCCSPTPKHPRSRRVSCVTPRGPGRSDRPRRGGGTPPEEGRARG